MTSSALAHTVWSPASVPPQRAFEALVARYTSDLLRYARWLSGSPHIAEDLVQETWLRAWRSLESLQTPAAAKSWLFTIVRRENARRFERSQTSETELPLKEFGDTDRGYDTSTEAFVLRHVLKELAPEYREPLLLQVVHGYSQKEIANYLGMSSAGVGTRLFRARQKLREMLAD